MATPTDIITTFRAPGGSPGEIAAMRDILYQMNNTLTILGQSVNTLNQQSSKISEIGPTMQETSNQVQDLRRHLKDHNRKQATQIKDLRQRVQVGIKEQVVEEIRGKIQEQIRTQIEMQTQQQVDIQIKEHLPVSLRQQSEENKQQIKELREAHTNSVARRSNATLPETDLDEPLEVVLRTNGMRSRWFPADLRSLYSYDVDMSKKLVKDYGFNEDDVREVNLNRFMAHIGIQFHLPMPT